MGHLMRSVLFVLLAQTLGLAGSGFPPVPPAMQLPPKVVPEILSRATPDNVRISVSLSRQRIALLVGDEIAIDSPASTGCARGPTPAGDYKVSEKRDSLSSDLYGDFVDASGFPIRAGVSTRVDSAPAGTVFRTVPATCYLRLAPGDIVIHSGRLPGYPAADRAIRVPSDIAGMIYARTQPGTPVRIED